MDRFDKFTDDARRTLTLSQDEAQRYNHNYVGTEHLLLGLLRVKDGVAARTLTRSGIDLDKVRTAVEFIIGRGDRPVAGEVGLTPRAKRVIELAIEEARQCDHHLIGDGHLLLGLVREGKGIAAGVLESLGVTLERLRVEVLAEIAAAGAGAAKQPLDSPAARALTHQVISSGSPWEERIGFSRAVRIENRVVVSGTAPIWPDGSCDPDPERQTVRCIEIIEAALTEAGASLIHVIRTRIFLTSAEDADAVGRAHAAVFASIRPASTMVVVAGFLDPRWRVEIEAEAQIS